METTEFFGRAPLSEREAMLVSPGAWPMWATRCTACLVRTELVLRGGKARAMHKSAVGSVNAAAQAAALEQVESLLTQTEADIVRQGPQRARAPCRPAQRDPRRICARNGAGSALWLFVSDRAGTAAANHL